MGTQQMDGRDNDSTTFEKTDSTAKADEIPVGN
jgi:hypothetical protein